jgi:hypothetical protein
MSRSLNEPVFKDPDSIEPYGIDWSAWLAELGAGVTISTSTYVVSSGPDGEDGSTAFPFALELSGASIVTGSKKTQVTLHGGTMFGDYQVTNHIEASDGSEDDRTFEVRIVER